MASSIKYVAIALLLVLLPVSQVVAVNEAVVTGLVSPIQQSSITYFVYNVTVPSEPSALVGVEFHAGLIANDNSTVFKSTIAYGCQIDLHKACYPPFLDRYIFYVSLIDISSLYRTQIPKQGYIVTPNDTYTITFSKTGVCSGVPTPSWQIQIRNVTAQFGRTLCGFTLDFNRMLTGMMEIHEVSSCNILPAEGSYTQENITTNLGSEFTWSPLETNPIINCNFQSTYQGDDVKITWTT